MIDHNLKKLADDLGHQRALRLAGIVTVVLTVGWFGLWLVLVGFNKPRPDVFPIVDLVLVLVLVIITILMLFNFDKLRETKEDLEELMVRSKRDSELVDLLRPMVLTAFQADQINNIRPALVEFLIKSVTDEHGSDKSAVCRGFLSFQLESVKELVRQQCHQMLMAKQRELESSLAQATKSGVPLASLKREALNVEIQQIEKVLELIPKAPDPNELKVGQFHVYHVPEAHVR